MEIKKDERKGNVVERSRGSNGVRSAGARNAIYRRHEYTKKIQAAETTLHKHRTKSKS